MKFSHEWLCDLAGIRDVPPHQAAEILTMTGWNVDEVELIDLSEIRVGRIVSQEPHPSSKKPLWIHQVDLGDHVRQIVAGAPNAVPGSLVPVALPGTTVPNGITVRDAKIAGADAKGMLCSAAELKLPEDVDGILLLDDGAPGQPLEELIPSDAIFEVEVTPNRPDCLGHLGLARELAAALGRGLGRDFMPPFTGGVEPPGTDLIDVAIEAPDLCRRYIGAPISGVRVGPSPLWLRRRLFVTGVRPISNVVDVTNYVALEYGQPLHAFDITTLAGRRIVVRRGRAGERLLCLDGETRPVTPDTLVIADAERPVALAGIIGGEETAVREGTTDLLLEAANFDGVNVRATSRALKLRTEASARFEKRISPELALAGARRAVTLLAEIAGGRVHVEWADVYPRPQEPARVRFRPAQVDAVLGVHVPLQEMESILKRLDFQVRVQDDGEWDLLPPVYRLDVSIPEDVAEEIGRMHGYENVPATLPGHRRGSWRPATPGLERRLDAVRQALAGAGFTEVVTPALTSGALLDRLEVGEGAMRVLNPVSDDQDTLRTALLPSLLGVAQHNRNHGRPAVAAFEIGRAYLRRPDRPQGQPDEPVRLAVVRTGLGDPEAGRRAFLELKGALERALDALAPVETAYAPDAATLFHPGRCALVTVCGQAVGHLGELHPSVAGAFDVEGRAVALEIALEPVLAIDLPRRARPLPRLPAVNRDLGIVVEESVPAGELLRVIKSAGGELLERATAFDEYRGAQVPEGRKSVAFALTFRGSDRTLTDAEVDRELEAIRAALRKRHDAAFRA
jgi:phenylalanyl-tRNA synthetase beta chain